MFTGNRTPTVIAQDNSFVSTQEWKNVKTRKLTQNIKRETGENSGKRPSQNAGLVPPVDYFACDNSTIQADRYDGIEADEITLNNTFTS